MMLVTMITFLMGVSVTVITSGNAESNDSVSFDEDVGFYHQSTWGQLHRQKGAEGWPSVFFSYLHFPSVEYDRVRNIHTKKITL